MKPYYEHAGIVIFNSDCREIIPTLEIMQIVLVTDPPYGIAFSSSMGGRFTGNKIHGDSSLELRDWILNWRRDKPALMFGSWKTPTPTATHSLLVWDKGPHVGMGNLAVPWKPNHEFIYVIGAGFIGHRGSGVLRINAPSPNFVEQLHPTEKPVALMRELVGKCPQEWVILDPFMGSGTTLVAAKQLGRRAIGVEICREYCDIAVERLRQEVLPLADGYRPAPAQPQQMELDRCAAEQSAAAEGLRQHPGDRGLEQWRDDFIAEEAILRGPDA